MFNHKTGELLKDKQGKPIPRPKGAFPPCRFGMYDKECAKVSPDRAHEFELSPKNELCYQHYKECKAVGQFPDDPTVRRNAALIESVENDCRRLQEIQILSLKVMR